MRGRPDPQTQLFYTIDVESRIRENHPLRPLKKRVDQILESMDELFCCVYKRDGRPGVPPERLLKAMLLMAHYSVRSEPQLCERIDTDLLFCWFLALASERSDRVGHHGTGNLPAAKNGSTVPRDTRRSFKF